MRLGEKVRYCNYSMAIITHGLDVGIALAEAVAAVERPGAESVGVEPVVEPVVD